MTCRTNAVTFCSSCTLQYVLHNFQILRWPHAKICELTLAFSSSLSGLLDSSYFTSSTLVGPFTLGPLEGKQKSSMTSPCGIWPLVSGSGMHRHSNPVPSLTVGQSLSMRMSKVEPLPCKSGHLGFLTYHIWFLNEKKWLQGIIVALDILTGDKIGTWLESWLGILVPVLGLDMFGCFFKTIVFNTQYSIWQLFYI